MWLRGHHVGVPARLEATDRDHLLPISHQDGEGVEGPPQDGIGTVVEQRQQWHVAVPADSTWEAASSSAGSSAGSMRLAAVLNLLLTISDRLSVNCICFRKF